MAWCGLNFGFAQTWTQTSAPSESWGSVASSADGTKLVAVVYDGGIYTSTNSGTTWTQTSAPNGHWFSVASSADGTKLAAANYTSIFTSSDSGSTWISNNVSAVALYSIASSADGNKLVAVGFSIGTPNGTICTSTNAGATWTQASAPSLRWSSIASSADGTKLVAAVEFLGGVVVQLPDGPVYTSTNSGITWTISTAPSNNWHSVASSADGTKLAAASVSGSSGIYTSTNSGMTWAQTSAPHGNWGSIVSSADGTRLIAVNGNYIYTSTNSGSTWTSNNAPITSWTSVASSVDGNEMIASEGGSIYIAQITPAPSMNIRPSNGNLTVSWIVPSMNFVMQQSSDLQDWADMTNQPVVNLTNLQNEVILSPPGSNVFYRLKTP